MAARTSPLASPGREPRQARKGAAAAADASAGVWLVRVASIPTVDRMGRRSLVRVRTDIGIRMPAPRRLFIP